MPDQLAQAFAAAQDTQDAQRYRRLCQLIEALPEKRGLYLGQSKSELDNSLDQLLALDRVDAREQQLERARNA